MGIKKGDRLTYSELDPHTRRERSEVVEAVTDERDGAVIVRSGNTCLTAPTTQVRPYLDARAGD